MAETLKDVIEQLKIQNTSSKLPVVGEIKNLGTQFGKLNFNFKRFTDSSVQLNSEMMEKNELINAENLSNQNDNAELLNLQLMDIGNVFSTKIDDLKSLLVDGPRVSDEMLNEVKNQSNYMQELGMMQGDYFTELKQQLITNDAPTVAEKKEDDSDDKVAKDTLVISKDSNSILNQMMSFFMAESERDKLREQEEKNERKSAKPLSEKTVDPSRLIRGNKGILGILQDFLTTAFLGSKGKALLRSLIPGKFTLGGFGKTLMTGIAGVLFGPELIKVISNAFDGAMKEEGIGNMALEGAKTFLKDADTSTLAAVGGVGGLLLGGVPGAITGALLGISVKAIGNALTSAGEEKTVIDLATGDVTKLQGLLGGATTGAGIGFMMGGPTIMGRLAGMALGAGIGALAGFANSNEPMTFTDVVFGALGLAGGVFASAKIGALMGVGGGPLGMIAGALIGAALGLAFSAIGSQPSKIQQNVDKIGQDAQEMVEAKNEISQGINVEENKKKLEEKEKEILNLAKDTLDMEEVQLPSNNLMTKATIMREIETSDLEPEKKKEMQEEIYRRDVQDELNEFNRIFQTNHKDLQSLYDTYWVPGRFWGGDWELPNDKTFKVLDEKQKDRLKQRGKEPVYKAEKGDDVSDVLFELLNLRGGKLYNNLFESKSMWDLKNNQGLAQGALFTPEMGPITAVINENARFSPEGVFNKPQMQYIADLIKPKETVVKFKSENDFVKNPQIQERYVAMNTMQTENEARRREMATPIVMPPSAPNIVDNKNITVQEQFNVTEMLPAPSSHVSFKDNIVY